ncbi:DNA-processing protein DprA [Flammeovirga sp. EKP202]|uniref:DNA-processing protein DprA n=1 Tax=Flammeovirga sp. EKP202 TaxID=2770592 RepID=UPI00165F8CF5|nr:DNA-processing protein DprA [Flammeovirga sp. EKP202]MBD0401501.1 DNA-processing protein DprA [Flammeovirga sp. EKP202]
MIEFLILSILNIKGFGPKFLFRNEKALRNAEKKCSSVREAITLVLEETKRINKTTLEDIEKGITTASQILDNCKKYSIHPISFLNDHYPQNVLQVSELWPVLYVAGNEQILNEYSVGVIGTKNPDKHGQIISQKITEFSDEEEITLNVMHQKGISAIVKETKDNFLIEVVASGIDQVYLPDNDIFHSDSITVVSPFPPEVTYDDYKYIEACKVLASLSNRVVLIQDTTSDDTRFVLSYFARSEKVLGVIKPIDSAINYPINSGNKLLISDEKEGLISYCRAKDVHKDSVVCDIKIITSKNDYPQFFKEEELPF